MGMALAISPHDHFVFTCGACHQLAFAIHEATGWPVCAFWGVYKGKYDYDVHAFVRTPRGTFLDIDGEHTRYGMCKKWHSRHIHTVRDVTTFMAEWDSDCWCSAYDRARELVPTVLAFYEEGTQR
jgi:hypothetical protein